uniref:C2H2-type domain-containing protein n=1 Tax=Poecilia reticulata TaxID=8081 RepID=A0A3P9PWB5_POERE
MPTLFRLCSAAASEKPDWSSNVEFNKEEPPSHIKEEDVWSDPPGEKNVGFLFQNNSARTQQDNDSTGSLGSKFCQDLNDPDIDLQPGTSAQQTCSELNDDQPVAVGNSQHDCVDMTLPKVVDSYICTICGQAFYQRSQWAKHTRIHRKVDDKGDKSFTCDICGKRLTRSDGYQKHLRVHTDKVIGVSLWVELHVSKITLITVRGERNLIDM